MSTELELHHANGVTAPPAAPVTSDIDSWTQVAGAVIKLANQIYDTPFVPDGLRGSAPAVAAAILAGREIGVGPMTALQQIHVIKGKPAQSALLMRALIIGKGHDWRDLEVSDTQVVVEGRRKGESQWARASFTREQARLAGIDLGKYPQDKLYARATARLARRKFADVIVGMPTAAEELEDEPDGSTPQHGGRVTAKDITTRPAPPPDASPADNTPSPPYTPAEPAGEAPDQPSGDDENTTPDTPGTRSGPQLTAIWTIFSTVFGFRREDKDQARAVCAHIIGRALESTNDLSHSEARRVLDTLADWRATADAQEVPPREYLDEIMTAQTEAGDV
jgi:hypothetical protein